MLSCIQPGTLNHSKGSMTKRLVGYLAVALGAMVVVFAAGAHPVSADTEVVSSSITSEYPEGIRLKLEVKSDVEITEIERRARVGQRTIGQVDQLCKDTGAPAEDWRCEDLDPGTSVKAELFWRTAYTASYMPPGVIIVYSFAIRDAEGGVHETEPEEFIYLPTAFEWDEITKGPVTVAFHGPVQSRAETILDTILETIEKMEPAMGIEIVDPIRVTVFNNQVEMIEAQQRRSGATTRQTATLGQASTEEGVLIMIADRNSIGTASHEVMHILVHRAGDSPFRNVPSWLDEGLAEYGNIDVGYEYDIALEFAVETGILLPFMYMATPPSEPEQLIIFYGQGKSIARLMIQRWGEAKMAELLAHHKQSGNIEKAIEDVYGIALIELENLWRGLIDAEPFIPNESGRAKPTPVPQRTLGLFSLTPQAGTEVIGSSSATPTPEPAEETATVAPTPPPAEEGSEDAGPSGFSCGAPLHGGAGALDLAGPGLLLGLAFFAVRRRRG